MEGLEVDGGRQGESIGDRTGGARKKASDGSCGGGGGGGGGRESSHCCFYEWQTILLARFYACGICGVRDDTRIGWGSHNPIRSD